MIVCAWLWISGLLLMGKILKSLGESAPSMDAVGALQIFFLLFTAACAGLYFLWTRSAAVADQRQNSLGI
jgi:hypothetical protein